MTSADDAALPASGDLYDEAACGLLLTDVDGTIRKANNTFCRWLGYVEADLVGARRIQELLTMGGRIFHQTHWAPLLHMQGSIAEVKLDVLHSDGHTIPVVLNAVRRNHGGKAVHELAVFVASDRHRYEKELLQERKRAELLLIQQKAAQDAVIVAAEDRAQFAEQMMGIVSHDLRNPLATIFMSADLVSRAKDTAAGERYVGFIMKAAQRAQRLIEDLLDFTAARIGRGLSVNPTPIDFHRAIGDGVDSLRFAHPNSTLVHRTLGNGICKVDGDRMNQVLGNLVNNAVAYGDPDQPISITSVIDESTFALTVHNSGAPIPPALIPNLFAAMTRGDQEGGGARSVGLGLYIVREIMKSHGGAIQVDSTAERGTTFKASFPRDAAEPTPPTRPPTTGQPRTPENSPPNA